MSLIATLARSGNGKRRALTPDEANKRIAQLEEQNEDLTCAVSRSVIRIAGLEERLKTQAGKVVRRDAELRRLAACLKETQRQLICSRPRITVVNAMDRPYVAAVPIPYPVPVGRSTANETTQQLPLLELPAA